MELNLHEFPKCVDFFDVTKLLKAKYGIDYRDYAGKYSDEGKKEEQENVDNWLKENGYFESKYVLNYKDLETKEDWPKDSPEMNLRREINNKLYQVRDSLSRPYLDFWHTMCDYISRGGINYLYLDTSEWSPDESLPKQYQNWEQDIMEKIKEIVKDSPAYDKDEQCLTYTVDW